VVVEADSGEMYCAGRGGVDLGRAVGAWIGLGVPSALVAKAEVRPPVVLPGVLWAAVVAVERVLMERSMLFRRPWGAAVAAPASEEAIEFVVRDARPLVAMNASPKGN
jgi:hypothetical protein